MAIVTGDRYLEKLVKFVEEHAGALIEGTKVLKLNPAGHHYVHSRLEALHEVEMLLAGAPVDYLRAYVSDLGDHRALEQLRRMLRLLTSLKVVSVLPPPARDPTPLSLLPFGRLRILELRGCDLSTSAAKGLLELRHTLEKIICHNSTDALRHVFASRIAEIKDSPQWKHLSFVSCACNRLVLMDESLQLLPAVETLDLSRNKFAKVDNLRKCTKLKHLDLGFNHLRTISYFSETLWNNHKVAFLGRGWLSFDQPWEVDLVRGTSKVSCPIVKLVLRNNALTTLRGIENLKSLEGLDISYNIISNFSELEFLAGLLSLQNLWLEGNPLCCAGWYRPQVFSYFAYPDKLKLDDKKICTREFWKRQIIIASRQKRPASFGFYSPAKDDAEGEGSTDRKMKKVSRLASIESEEESTSVCSDQESGSCDNEIERKEQNVNSDDEAGIVDLMNRVEHLKKERSVLWLREFKEWMDHSRENVVDVSNNNWDSLPRKESYMKSKKSQRHHGESSRCVSDSVQASGDESSTNILNSDNSFADMSTGLHAHQYFDHNGSLGITAEVPLPGVRRMDKKQGYLKSCSQEGISTVSMQAESLHLDTLVMEGHKRVENDSVSPLTAFDDITESLSSYAYTGSPPHYQEDILHRRNNLVEEILQLSAESYSVASSDSNTSYSEDDFCESEQSILEDDQSLNQECLYRSIEQHFLSGVFGDNSCDQRDGIPRRGENGACLLDSRAEQTSSTMKTLIPDQSLQSCSSDCPAGVHDGELASFVNKEGDWLERRKGRRKLKRRVVSLLEENNIVANTETSQKPNSNLDISGADVEDERGKQNFDRSHYQRVINKKQICPNAVTTPLIDYTVRFSGAKCSSPGRDDLIEDYFSKNVADSKIHETCRLCMRCDCVLEPESTYREREVALLLSSENKLYVLLVDVAFDGSGTILSLLGWHRVEDVREVLVGLGLQIVRIYIEEGATYLFITRSIEKSAQLLQTLQLFDSQAANDKCALRSLEQVQVELFEKQICGGLKLSIFQYSMVLFWCSNGEEGSWLSRSLFVIGGHVVVCVEDFMQFSSLSLDASSPSYFSLDSCCSITDVFEMVIEGKESWCLTLALERATSEFCPSIEVHPNITAITEEKTDAGCRTWKLKWFSEESLFKFVALLKAIHAGISMSPLLVRCVA